MACPRTSAPPRKEVFYTIYQTSYAPFLRLLEKVPCEYAGHTPQFQSLVHHLLQWAWERGLFPDMTEDEIGLIAALSAYHDAGKAMLPPTLLYKEGPLTLKEFEVLKTHPEWGEFLVDLAIPELRGHDHPPLCLRDLPLAPRAMGRRRVPRRPEGERDSPVCAGRRPGRRLRRAGGAAQLQAAGSGTGVPPIWSTAGSAAPSGRRFWPSLPSAHPASSRRYTVKNPIPRSSKRQRHNSNTARRPIPDGAPLYFCKEGSHLKKLYKVYVMSMTLMMLMAFMVPSAFAVDDMWTVANTIIVDVYSKIAGISTVLAGLMSAVAVVGAKISNNRQQQGRSGMGLAQAHLDRLGRHQRHRRIHRLCRALLLGPRHPDALIFPMEKRTRRRIRQNLSGRKPEQRSAGAAGSLF